MSFTQNVEERIEVEARARGRERASFDAAAGFGRQKNPKSCVSRGGRCMGRSRIFIGTSDVVREFC
jgi:hypothetical protein